MAYKRVVPRKCRACLAPRPTTDAPDPCLGWLPGVQFACCGHGSLRMAYLTGEAVPPMGPKPESLCRGLAALQRMRELGGNPPEPTDTSGEYRSLNWCWPRS